MRTPESLRGQNAMGFGFFFPFGKPLSPFFALNFVRNMNS
jgi:hypothetical protein